MSLIFLYAYGEFKDSDKFYTSWDRNKKKKNDWKWYNV